MGFAFCLHSFHIQISGVGLQGPEAMMIVVSLTSSRAPLTSPAHSVLECRPPHCSLNPSDTLWPGAFVLSLSQGWNILFLLTHLAHSLTTSSPCCSFSSRRPLLNALLLSTAKSLQSCPTLCDPIDGSPPGSPIPGILQARTLEWVAISFSNASKWKVKMKSLSRVWPLATPWTAAF